MDSHDANPTGERRTFYRARLANFILWGITAWAALYFLIELLHEVKGPEPSVFLTVLDGILMIGFAIPAVRVRETAL